MLQKRVVQMFLMAAAAMLMAAGPSYKMKLKPYDLQSTDFQMPSGLRLLFQEDRSQPSVMLTTVYDVGSAGDPVGKEGIAHLVEHLAFKALHEKNPKVWDHMKQLGATNFNAFTADDITQYYTQVPKESLVPMLKIEAMRMQHTIRGVTEKDLETEREVVRNELRMRTENTVNNKLYELAKEMVYPKGHTYHRTGIGTHESLSNITLKDVQDFVDKWYQPEHATVVVAGNFDKAQIGSLLNQAFPFELLAAKGQTDKKITPVQHKPRITGKSAEPPPPADRTLRKIKGPVPRTTVLLAWSMPGAYRSNQPLMEVTVQSMAQPIASLIYGETYDPWSDDDKIEGLGCFLQPNKESAMAMCFIELGAGQDPEKIAKNALDALSEMWNSDNEEGMEFGIGEDRVRLPGQRKSFAIARAQYQAAIFHQSATLERAVSIASYMHFTGKPDYFTSSIKEVGGIKSFDARDLAFKYLKRDRAVTLIVEPFSDKDAPSPVAFNASSSWAGATFESNAVTEASKATPEQIEALAVTPDTASIKEFTLKNGLRVLVKKHGGAPFVTVGLYTKGGSATADPVGFPDFAFSDSDTQDPGKIAGDWTGGSYGDGSMRGVTTPSGNFDEALDLVYDRASTTRSTWTRRRFDRAIEQEKRRLKTEEKRPDIWGERALWNLLMPGHPMATAQARDAKALDALGKLDAKDFEKWFEKTLAPKNATLVVVGDVDLAEAEKKITKVWGKWRIKDQGAPMKGFPDAPASLPQQIAFVDSPEATQTDLTVACQVRATVENDATRDVLTSLLREDLFFAIRERAGASYGVGVGMSRADADTSLLFVSSLVQNDKAKPALKTILDRLAEVRNGKVDPKKLNEVKWNVASATRAENESAAEMMGTLTGLVRNGLPVSSLNGYPKRLAAVTAKDLQTMLEPCTGREVITAVGPEKLVRAPFESLKIPVQMVDWRKGADSKPDVDTKQSSIAPATDTAKKK